MGNRVALAVVLIAAIFAPALCIASSTTETPTETAAADQCTALDGEWKTAEAACATNVNLGRARALAREAETKCKSAEASQRKIGVGKYQSALRLCRKPEGGH